MNGKKLKLLTMLALAALFFCGATAGILSADAEPIFDKDTTYNKQITVDSAISFDCDHNIANTSEIQSMTAVNIPNGLSLTYNAGSNYYTITGTLESMGLHVFTVVCERTGGGFVDTWKIMSLPENIITLNGQETFSLTAGEKIAFKNNYKSTPSVTYSYSLTEYPSWLTKASIYSDTYWYGTAVTGSYDGVALKSLNTTYNVKFNVGANITLNANGGSLSDGQSIKNYTGVMDKITLPSASLSGNSFDGWYTAPSGGTRVGGSGASYLPTTSVTLYAHWSAIVYYVNISSTCVTQVTSGGTFSYSPTMSPSMSTLTIMSDPTNCLYVDGQTIKGTLENLLPGTYYVKIRASYSGYQSATQTIQINVPVFVYDPLSDTVVMNEKWSYQLTANPQSAKITAYKITDNSGSIVDPSVYDITKTDKSISVSFNAVGVYNVDLTVSATGYTSTTKRLSLSVIDPNADMNDPTFGSINIQKYVQLDGAFFCTVYQPAHYTSITWNFGDGSDVASGDSVIHKYTSSGSKTITVTLFNKYTNTSKIGTETVNVTLELKSITDAWEGKEYSYSFIVTEHTGHESGSYVLSAKYTDETDQNWLNLEVFDDADIRYVLVSGTPQETLAGKTLSIKVNYAVYGTDGTTVTDTIPIAEWTIDIWEFIDESTIKTGFTTEISDRVVTITNNGTTGLGVKMYVDWGDGKGSIKQSTSSTATNTYTVDGFYNIVMELIINGVSYKSTGYATIPGNTQTFLVTYVANDQSAVGSMTNQSGQLITVLNCEFTVDGKKFVEWNSAADGTGTSFNPGDQIEPSENLTLFAQWSAVTDTPDEKNDADNTLKYVIIAIAVILFILVLTRVI